MDDKSEEIERFKDYIKSGGDSSSNFINGVNYTTPDKALPSDLYKTIMDEIGKNPPSPDKASPSDLYKTIIDEINKNPPRRGGLLI